MYAIIPLSGRQHRVEPGSVITVDRLDKEPGDVFTVVPLLAADGATRAIGDAASKVTVNAKVVDHLRGPKLIVFKYRKKKGSKTKRGFRAAQTRVEITGIEGL